MSKTVSKRTSAASSTMNRIQLNSQLGFNQNVYALTADDSYPDPLSISLPNISYKMLAKEKLPGIERDFFFNYKMSELTSTNVLLKLGTQVENYTKNEIAIKKRENLALQK